MKATGKWWSVVVAGAGLLVWQLAGCSASSDAAGYTGGNLVTGGAQDIGYFRDILEEGGVPGPRTLDANGFFNEHWTELPPPQCGEKVCLQAMLSVSRDWVTGEYERFVQIGLNTPLDPTRFQRKPMNLVLVVDVSGSMSAAGKLEYVKQGLHLLVDELEEGDRVGLVTYSDEVRVLVDLGQEVSRQSLHEYVDMLEPGGTTNLYGGLEAGMEMAAANLSPERYTRVILLSDGLPTAGNTDPQAIREMAESYVTEGIGLTTIGVGNEFDVNLMRGLAESGAGNFYYVEDPAAVEEVFTEELAYFLVPVATDVTITVRSGSNYTLKNVVGAARWEVADFGGSMWIPAIFLASRTPDATDQGRRGGGSAFFVETEPLADNDSDLADMVEVTLTYTDAETGEGHTQSVLVRDPFGPKRLPDSDYFAPAAMEKNAAVFHIYKGLYRACEAARTSYEEAERILLELRRKVGVYLEEHPDDEDIAEDARLIDLFLENLRNGGSYRDAPGPSDDYYRGGDTRGDMVVMCNASASGVAWYWMLWLGLVLVVRRRK